MSDKKYFDKSIDELSVKEALTWDAGNAWAKHTLMIDPAPVSITPIVIGKRAVKVTKRIIKSIKSRLK